MRGDGHCRTFPPCPGWSRRPREAGKRRAVGGVEAGVDPLRWGVPTMEGLLSLSLSVTGPHPALCLASSALKLGQTGCPLVAVSHGVMTPPSGQALSL